MSRLNIVLSVFLALAVIAGIILMLSNRGLRSDLGTTKGQLKRTIKESERRLDSALNLVAKSEARVKGFEHFIEQQAKEREADLSTIKKLEKQHEKDKRTRTNPNIADADLDSAITRLVEDLN